MTTTSANVPKPRMHGFKVQPNLDYEKVVPNFRWDDAYEEMDWLPGGRLNMAHEAIDRHANGRNRDKTAMVWQGRDGERETYTFGQLKNLTGRFANVLKSLGVAKGDRVFIYMDRVPEYYVAFFGILKIGAIAGPLFSRSGPEAVKDRMKDSEAKILVTQPDLRRRISGIIPELFELQHMVIVNKNNRDPFPLDMADLGYDQEMGKASSNFDIVPTGEYDHSVMHYTSGTTGKPKGVVHRHHAVIQQHATGKWALDLHPEDIYWCTADLGWAIGTSYGMLAPWTNGVTQVVSEGCFSADSHYEMIQKNRVTVWCTTATVIQMLMEAGVVLPGQYDLSSLRHVSCIGEPLSREAFMWGARVFGTPVHDNWFQTETGAVLIANYPCMDVRPGSMGRPVPGIEAAVVDHEYNPVSSGEDGCLAFRPGWPSMFHTYWRDEDLYNERFRRGRYVTGDLARRDDDGYFWFRGRADDMIKAAGRPVGSLEVESALAGHPALAEVGVIGKPDQSSTQVVKAFVCLRDGYEPTDEQRQELLRFGRDRLDAAAAPQEMEFLASLPRTFSGSMMRRLLRARELGLPQGDISTLEKS